MKPSPLKSALVSALGISALAATSVVSAGVITASWTGYITLLDASGDPMANTSLYKTNQFVTSISGTLAFDDVTGAGTATLVPFNFFLNNPSLPMTATSIELQAIGDGLGGAGTLVLGNMLFDWNGNSGIPVSLVLDAAGFFAGEYAPGGANSAVSAADGTYINATHGYLNQGAMPIVTTAWNTSFATGCVTYSCMNVSPSGILPLVFDTAINTAYDGANTGGSIGGSPMAHGPFQDSNANFQIANLTNVLYDPSATIAAHCDWGGVTSTLCVPQECIDNPYACLGWDCEQSPEECDPAYYVPIPAATWLFSTGLLSLIGVARRRSQRGR